MTLLEVLSAILLLGILLAVSVPILVGLLGLSGKSGTQLGSSVSAQRTIEKIKGAWQIRGCYDNNIVPGLDITGLTLTIVDLDSRAQIPSPATTSPNPSPAASCASATPPGVVASMRRVTVSTGNKAQDTTLTLDIRRP